EDFFKQKIVWGNLNLQASYCIAEPGMFINAPCSMIVDASNYLLAVLNSKVADYYIRSLGVTRNGGYFEYKPMFIEKLPVPMITELKKLPFEELVNEITKTKLRKESTIALEKRIDSLIFDLYGLDDEEINFITNFEYK
ncbi:TaqI-like C-terminal specificity domain-containing protein, partial [Mucilaginibacter sp. Mucisp84]|uniref:TaqI-like C-terminal specificity domain-containing protein n=1 Tax=Mucilaginibacter sp. Mucisp84 TaxID=3243058 RepID=UPI0039A6E389